MEQTDKYAYSFDNESYFWGYDSVEGALKAAQADTEVDDDYVRKGIVYIGKVCEFEPIVDAWRAIEHIKYDADDEVDDTYGYLDDVQDDEVKKLQDVLTEAFNRWAKETNHLPSFCVVKEVKEYDL